MAGHSIRKPSHQLKDIIGRKFGRLTALHIADVGRTNKPYLACVCDCGASTTVRKDHLVNGKTASCGCFRHERFLRRIITHGMSKSHEWRIWAHAKARCENPHDKGFKDYGGRGIYMCAGWHSFEHFIADMGRRPSQSHSIDRIDNAGGYTCGHCDDCLSRGAPANCRWANDVQQSRNRRSVRLLTIDGVAKTIPEWSEELKISESAIHSRLSMGWSDEDALTIPVKSRIILTLNGMSKTASEWVAITGINYNVLCSRKKRGWTDERALTTAVKHRRA